MVSSRFLLRPNTAMHRHIRREAIEPSITHQHTLASTTTATKKQNKNICACEKRRRSQSMHRHEIHAHACHRTLARSDFCACIEWRVECIDSRQQWTLSTRQQTEWHRCAASQADTVALSSPQFNTANNVSALSTHRAHQHTPNTIPAIDTLQNKSCHIFFWLDCCIPT